MRCAKDDLKFPNNYFTRILVHFIRILIIAGGHKKYCCTVKFIIQGRCHHRSWGGHTPPTFFQILMFLLYWPPHAPPNTLTPPILKFLAPPLPLMETKCSLHSVFVGLIAMEKWITFIEMSGWVMNETISMLTVLTVVDALKAVPLRAHQHLEEQRHILLVTV